jgi:hypothetical protein
MEVEETWKGYWSLEYYFLDKKLAIQGVKGVVVAKWGPRNKFSQFQFYVFLWKYEKLQAFWYSFYFDTWLGKHFLMSSKIFCMKKVEISWFLEI